MEKITTGVSYTTSAVGTGYWLLQLLDKVPPAQRVAGSYTHLTLPTTICVQTSMVHVPITHKTVSA
ncbi:phage holin, partial [Escherichia coli]|uniref:phage holin n=1 Tax=Escherichia coli TaxID=562 RepID=UPI00201A3C48